MAVWIIFLGLITVFLALDLGVFNRVPHVINTREASFWTSLWVTIALSFSGVIFWLYSNNMVANIDELSPSDATLKYITGYLIELSLSLDNIFVIAVIFGAFKVPMKYQHRVLFWGILGAIIFRGLMIFFGVYLIHKFSWVSYIFGAFLIFTSYKMLVSKEENKKFDPKHSFIYRTFKGFFRFAPARRRKVFCQAQAYRCRHTTVYRSDHHRIYRHSVCPRQCTGYFGHHLGSFSGF